MSKVTLLETGYSNLIETLAYLASEKAQERYIVGGTKEEYIVPDDLLEDLITQVEFFKFRNESLRMERLRSKLGEDGLKKLESLLAYIDEHETFLERYTNQDLAELVRSDVVWLDIRYRAAQILGRVQFDMEAWESKNA